MRISKSLRLIPLQFLTLVMIFGYMLAHPFTEAASSPPGENRPYILVINTYTESSVWSENIITSVLRRASQKNDCEVYTEHMNMMLIDDLDDVREFEHQLAEQYGKHAPRMVILLGSPIAIIRDFVKETWPGISLVFCAEEDYIGKPETYIALKPIPQQERVYMKTLAHEDNLTLLQTPVFLNENVKFMERMIPGMDSLIFVGDGRYICQQTDADLREVLARDFPTLHYRFYSAAQIPTEQLLDSLAHINTRRTGVLFASWHFTKRQPNNNYIVFTDIYRVVASTPVPFFSIFPIGIKESDLIGGYVYNDNAYKRHLNTVIDAIMAGKQARDIPFYNPASEPFVDYQTLIRKGLSPKLCTPDTIFFDKPESALERYMWPIIIAGLVMLGWIVFQQWRIGVMQRIEESHQREKESRGKYTSLFDGMPICYVRQQILFDEKGVPINAIYSDANAEFERNFGRREEFIGKLVTETAVNKERLMSFINTVLKTGEPLTATFHHKSQDRYFEIFISNSYELGHIDIFYIDTTALHKAQDKLASINHKLSMALDVANIVPWKWDLQNHTIVCDVNRTVEMGSPEEFPDDTVIAVSDDRYFAKIHKEDRERVRRAYEDLMDDRTAKVREEYRVATLVDGRWQLDWVEAQAAVETRGEDGRPQTLVGSSLVITERKKMEDDLRTARDRAEESNRLKSAFLANMSHEIRTPLNAIVGFSGILASTDKEQEKQEYVSIIENNNTLLLQLIGDILDLSKIEAGTLDFVESDFDLNELMREEESVIGVRVKPEVELSFEPSVGECIVRCDRNRLSQVVINLLTNAAKFTQEGSIRFGYTIAGRELSFYVADTGCGMPAECIGSIFDRFVKLNTFQQGTGLGLPICKTIVEHMGGRIWVESEEGKGSTFRFTLPYVAGKLTPREEPEQTGIEVPKDKLTVLVAEDNESNFVLFDSILRGEYRLIHARNGREAVELFKEHAPHLVLMDINMPEMNGYEATEKIREISDSVPIVAVTAFAYASDEQQMLSNGFDSYIPKPINASKLKSLILETLRRRIMLI